MFTRYDLLFATSTPLTIAIPPILTVPIRRKPFVFEVRDLWPEIPEQMGIIKNKLLLKLLYLLEGLAYRTADRVIALSPGMVEGVTRNKWTRSDVVLIPNGADLKLFVPTQLKTPEIGGRKIERGFVFAGAHGTANGLDALIEVATELKRRKNTTCEIVLIGDGKEKPRLQRVAQERELSNIVFVPPIPKRELALLLPKFRGALMILANIPSFYYGTSPNKFFDYLAAGLPVVTNYPGWVADLISENHAGAAVVPGDIAAFADALERLSEDSAAAARFGDNARSLAMREFDRETLAQRFVEVLEECGHPTSKIRRCGAGQRASDGERKQVA